MNSLLIQIWNRRRSNVWIFIELCLVFILVWYMADYFLVLKYNLSLPNHRNVDRAWMITVGEYPEQSSEYNSEEASEEACLVNYRRVLNMLRNHDGVEAVSVSFWGSSPGSGSYNGTSFVNQNDSTKEVNVRQLTFDPEWDYFRVFGHTRENGKRPASTGDADWNAPGAIALSRSAAEALGMGVGESISYDRENMQDRPIVDIVDDTKRFDYNRPSFSCYAVERLSKDNIRGGAEIAVRLSSSAPAFVDAFRRDMQEGLRAGNYYFKKMTYFPDIARESAAEFGQTNDVRLRVYLMAFLLVNIMLCITGTFWYRVNQRREETGLRKALGASQSVIRDRLIAEGLILLALAAVPAVIVEVNIVSAGLIDTLGREGERPDLYLPDRAVLRFVVVNAVTAVVMSAVTVASIYIPAWRAASMPSAEALRYE